MKCQAKWAVNLKATLCLVKSPAPMKQCLQRTKKVHVIDEFDIYMYMLIFVRTAKDSVDETYAEVGAPKKDTSL